MRALIRPLGFPAIVALLAALASWPSGGGDPVPDVDVTVEQNPGAGFTAESLAGGFDRLTLGGSRAFVESLTTEGLPPGWTLTREGKSAVLSASPGTPTDRPVRFRLQAAARGVVDWDVSFAGRSLAKAKNVVPRQVPPFAVKNSLQGLVYLPEEARAGETLSFRPATSDLPPGTFMLQGEVVDEIEESEWAAAMAVVNNTRSNIKGLAARPPDGGLVLTPTDGASCAELAGLAAALALDTGGAMAGYRVSRGEAPAEGTPSQAFVAANLRDLPAEGTVAGNVLETRHDVAMNAIRNMKRMAAKSDPAGGSGGKPSPAPRRSERAFYAVAEATGDGGAGPAGISIKEQGIEDQPVATPRPKAASLASPGGGLDYTLTGGQAGARRISIKEQGVQRGGGLPSDARYVALRVETTAEGCRFTPREPTELELARLHLHTTPREIESPPPASALPGATPGSLQGTVYVTDLPEDLPPGSGLAIQFIDRFGDVLVDVPRAPVEILAPRGAEESSAPCIVSSTAYAQAADAVCVCGSFPAPSAAWGLLVNERPLTTGAVLSTSSSVVWLRLPAGSTPGRHFLSGPAAAGFAPSCRAITQLIEIQGALDSARLLRGETTPMRLSIAGTADALPLRIRNLTPAIISIEGGDEQTASSSGGGTNVVERQVRALQRGSFNVEWVPATPQCPCAGPR